MTSSYHLGLHKTGWWEHRSGIARSRVKTAVQTSFFILPWQRGLLLHLNIWFLIVCIISFIKLLLILSFCVGLVFSFSSFFFFCNHCSFFTNTTNFKVQSPFFINKRAVWLRLNRRIAYIQQFKGTILRFTTKTINILRLTSPIPLSVRLKCSICFRNDYPIIGFFSFYDLTFNMLLKLLCHSMILQIMYTILPSDVFEITWHQTVFC